MIKSIAIIAIYIIGIMNINPLYSEAKYWEKFLVSQIPTEEFWGLKCADSLNFMIWGSYGGNGDGYFFRRTTDGGATWNTLTLPGTLATSIAKNTKNIYEIQFKNQDGIICKRTVDLNCDCDCFDLYNDVNLQIKKIKKENKCCYDIQLTSILPCSFVGPLDLVFYTTKELDTYSNGNWSASSSTWLMQDFWKTVFHNNNSENSLFSNKNDGFVGEICTDLSNIDIEFIRISHPNDPNQMCDLNINKNIFYSSSCCCDAIQDVNVEKTSDCCYILYYVFMSQNIDCFPAFVHIILPDGTIISDIPVGSLGTYTIKFCIPKTVRSMTSSNQMNIDIEFIDKNGNSLCEKRNINIQLCELDCCDNMEISCSYSRMYSPNGEQMGYHPTTRINILNTNPSCAIFGFIVKDVNGNTLASYIRKINDVPIDFGKNKIFCQYNGEPQGTYSIEFWGYDLYGNLILLCTKTFSDFECIDEYGAEVINLKPQFPTNYIYEFNKDNLLNIFPNPVNDEMLILSNDDVISINLYDNIGNKIMKTSYFQHDDNNNIIIKTNNYYSGLYILQIITNKNIITQK